MRCLWTGVFLINNKHIYFTLKFTPSLLTFGKYEHASCLYLCKYLRIEPMYVFNYLLGLIDFVRSI